MRLLALGVSALALTGASSPSWLIFRTHGISVRHPPSWHVTTRRLTAILWPPLRFAITSYPLHQRHPGSTCQPERALAEMPPRGAFIYAIEYTGTTPPLRNFPPRPKRFRLTHFASYECMGPSYSISFREAARFFQIHVYLGPRAGPAVRATVLRILDSFSARRV